MEMILYYRENEMYQWLSRIFSPETLNVHETWKVPRVKKRLRKLRLNQLADTKLPWIKNKFVLIRIILRFCLATQTIDYLDNIWPMIYHWFVRTGTKDICSFKSVNNSTSRIVRLGRLWLKVVLWNVWLTYICAFVSNCLNGLNAKETR